MDLATRRREGGGGWTCAVADIAIDLTEVREGRCIVQRIGYKPFSAGINRQLPLQVAWRGKGTGQAQFRV